MNGLVPAVRAICMAAADTEGRGGAYSGAVAACEPLAASGMPDAIMGVQEQAPQRRSRRGGDDSSDGGSYLA